MSTIFSEPLTSIWIVPWRKQPKYLTFPSVASTGMLLAEIRILHIRYAIGRFCFLIKTPERRAE